MAGSTTCEQFHQHLSRYVLSTPHYQQYCLTVFITADANLFSLQKRLDSSRPVIAGKKVAIFIIGTLIFSFVVSQICSSLLYNGVLDTSRL